MYVAQLTIHGLTQKDILLIFQDTLNVQEIQDLELLLSTIH